MSRRNGPSVRSLPPEAKRNLIFEAARAVITERGFDAAKMEEISTRAGVGKGTLYNLFESKEDLFFRLVMDGFERTRQLIDAEIEPIEDPLERFEVAWRTLMTKVFPELNRQWNFNYQIWGLLARDEAARERMFRAWRALYREREQEIGEAISEGQNRGHFRKDLQPGSIALLLMAIFDGLLHRAMFDASRVDPETALTTITRLVTGGLSPQGQRVQGRAARTGTDGAARRAPRQHRRARPEPSRATQRNRRPERS